MGLKTVFINDIFGILACQDVDIEKKMDDLPQRITHHGQRSVLCGKARFCEHRSQKRRPSLTIEFWTF